MEAARAKKPLDTTINLVPFIDLMAVTIVFLIMTAVWTQLGRLQVSQSGQNASEEQQQEQNPLQPVTLLVTEKELKLSVGGAQLDPIPITRDDKQRVDVAKLVDKLKELKTQQPEQNAITVSTEDAVRYEDLVRVIDDVHRQQLPFRVGLTGLDLSFEREFSTPWPSSRQASGSVSGSSTRRSSGTTAMLGKKSVYSDLNVTPLVDMFVILVLFLIANFSATGEILSMSKDIQLPEAANTDELQLAPVVLVSTESVIVSGIMIGRVDDLTREDYLNIPALEEKLREMKKEFEDLHNAANDSGAFKGDVNIQADKDGAVPRRQARDVQLRLGGLREHRVRHHGVQRQPHRQEGRDGRAGVTQAFHAKQSSRASGAFARGSRVFGRAARRDGPGFSPRDLAGGRRRRPAADRRGPAGGRRQAHAARRWSLATRVRGRLRARLRVAQWACCVVGRLSMIFLEMKTYAPKAASRAGIIHTKCLRIISVPVCTNSA